MALVRLERHDDVGLVRIDRPDALNALNPEVRQALIACFEEAQKDEGIRVLVLTGGDKVFVAGADIKVMAPLDPISLIQSAQEHVYHVMKAFPKPIVAAVEGYALGGGCELAMLCDIIVAGRGATFAQSEIRVGIMPGAGGTLRLTRAVGKFKAMRMLLTGDRIPAEDAYAMGLVSELAPEGQAQEQALKIARKIASMPPLAVRFIKQMVLQGEDMPLDSALAMERLAFTTLFASRDKDEGMAAFIERREPRFQGR